jgi:hypothetical protein
VGRSDAGEAFGEIASEVAEGVGGGGEPLEAGGEERSCREGVGGARGEVAEPGEEAVGDLGAGGEGERVGAEGDLPAEEREVPGLTGGRVGEGEFAGGEEVGLGGEIGGVDGDGLPVERRERLGPPGDGLCGRVERRCGSGWGSGFQAVQREIDFDQAGGESVLGGEGDE